MGDSPSRSEEGCQACTELQGLVEELQAEVATIKHRDNHLKAQLKSKQNALKVWMDGLMAYESTLLGQDVQCLGCVGQPHCLMDCAGMPHVLCLIRFFA